MSNIIAIAPRFDMPKGQEMTDLSNFCNIMAESPFYKKLGAGGVMAIVMTARELNLPIMSCLNGGLYTFDGKVSLSSQLMNALIIRAGHTIEIHLLTNEKCVLRFKRRNEKKFVEFSYTIQDAVKAGVANKDNWKKYTRDMLYWRCLASSARKIFPDVLGNIYLHEELNRDDSLQEVSSGTADNSDNDTDQEVKQVSFEKAEGFDNFVTKHCINDKNSKQYEYVQAISEISKKSRDEIVNVAVKNEEKFVEQFEKWLAKQQEKVEEETEEQYEDSDISPIEQDPSQEEE